MSRDQRTDERVQALVDALARQTALSEALKLVIGRSASPLDVVLEGLIESAVRLCRADWGVIYRLEDAKLRPAGFYGLDEERRAKWSGAALELDRRSAAGRCVVTRIVVEIPDVLLDAEYGLGEASRNVGWRSLLAVPLFRDDTLLGVFAVQRAQPGPFGDATVLLSALADQAVIAIDNAHLFQQLQARTQELTHSVEELRALGEISQAVSSSLDLETVLDTVVQASVRLARVDSGTIYTVESEHGEFVPRASAGLDEETLAAFRQVIGEARDNVVWQATATRRPAQVSDIETSPMSEATRATLRGAGFRALLAVPMVRAGEVVGALVVRRRDAGDFPGTVVRLLETFATQSAIAVYNARLFRELQDKGRELELAGQHMSQFLARLEAELEAARRIQLSMVPGKFPAPTAEAPVGIFASLYPARQVGGDLYDFFYISPTKLCVVVADISDKGVAAALFMARTKTLVRTLSSLMRGAADLPEPHEVVTRMNVELCEDNPYSMFATVFLGTIDLVTRELHYCNCGHPLPYLLGVDGVSELQSPRAKPLGIRPNFTYETTTRRLRVGDYLFLFTDGVTEALDENGELFSEARLEEVLRCVTDGSTQSVVTSVVEAVRRFAGAAPQSDDIAALAVRLVG